MRLVAVGLAVALTAIQAEPVYRITDLAASSTDIATQLVDEAVHHHGAVIATYDGPNGLRAQEILPTPVYIDVQIVPLINNLLGRPLWSK